MELGKVKIHTFGDSHSSFGWKKLHGIKTNHIGPILCYTFGKHGLNKLNIKKYNVKEGDYVCFSFGEIDCRCHVHKHITKDRDYKDVIDDLIELYFNSIELNIKQFNSLRVLVYNIAPPLKDSHRVVIKNKNVQNNPFPFLGNENQRKDYVNYFNQKLKKYCLKYDYIFLDVYGKYSDENGFLYDKYSDGHVHIDNPIFIKEFLKNI